MTRSQRQLETLAREFGCTVEQGSKHLHVLSRRGRLLFVAHAGSAPDKVPGGAGKLRARFRRELRRVGEQVA